MELDHDVEAVASFMQANIPAARLVSVARELCALAPFYGAGTAEKMSPPPA